jgi:DNA-binding response OmpR family regulator
LKFYPVHFNRDLPITWATMPGTTTPRALVVDDAPENRMLVSALLVQQGFDVDQASDGEAAVRAASLRDLDLIVLDLGLPDIDGVEVCRRVREFSDAHVLMLTAQDTELDKVVGFEAGADDYVTKPFSVAELVGRVKAVLRRAGKNTTTRAKAPAHTRRFGALTVDAPAREAQLDGVTLDLTRIEFDLLDTLTAQPRVAFSRAQLLERVWGENWFGDDHLVDVHISNLRRKLADDPRAPDFVCTVRGVGYRMGAGR